MDAKNVYEIKAKQEINDSPSGLLDGDGHLSFAKASSEIHKPLVQSLWFLFQDAAFCRTGIGRFEAKCVLITSPIQTNPCCIINSFVFHVSTPLLLCEHAGLVRRNPYGRVL